MAMLKGEIESASETQARDAESDGILERVAVTLASAQELKQVLGGLASIACEAAGAQRCCIGLVEDGHLELAAAVSRDGEQDSWTTAARAPLIEIRDEHWKLLRTGRAVAVEDARVGDRLPSEWVALLALRTIAVVPLAARNEPCGVLAAGWPGPRPIMAEQLAVLEAVGVSAGLAIHNTWLHRRMATKNRVVEHVAAVASTLNESTSLERILDDVCAAFEQVLGTTHCSVNLTDPTRPLRLRALASRGEPWFVRDGHPLVPEEVTPWHEIRRSPEGPVVYSHLSVSDRVVSVPVSVRSAALFPIFCPEGTVGAVVAGFPTETGPEGQELEAGQALADLAAAAIGRADLYTQLARRRRQLEVLSGLSELVIDNANLPELLASINAALGPELATHLDGLVVDDAAARQAVGGARPNREEREAIDAWRSSVAATGEILGLRRAGQAILVPVVRDRRVVAALRVAVPDDEVDLADEEFLLAIGSALAELIRRAESAAIAEPAASRGWP